MIYSAKKLEKLNNPERLKWIMPDKFWDVLNCKSGESYADIGAGSGFFINALERYLNKTKVYALDIQQEMIDYLKTNMPDNVSAGLITEGRFPIDDNSVDALWTITVYHEIENINKFLSEIKRVLKPKGRLIIVDWDKAHDACQYGPSFDSRISYEKICDDLNNMNFVDVQEYLSLFKWHYAVTATNRK